MPDDDMRIPTRDETQTARDAIRTARQVEKLGKPDQTLVDTLTARHVATPGTLQFEHVERRRRGRAFVEVEQAQASPTGDDKAAPRTMVTALQMVLKSVDGPAPTSVTVADFPKKGAVLASGKDEIVVALIDTGIDKAKRSDGWLNEVKRDRNGDNVDELDAIPQNGFLDFGAGHGTFVAGIVRQIEPRAKIVVYGALDSSGLASEKEVARALRRAADDGAHVISLSLGEQAVDDDHPCPHLADAVEKVNARKNPPAIVAAAGNYGTREKVYPAALPGVVSVAALQAVKNPRSARPPAGAKWSSRGTWVRCSAVGEGIVSTFVKGTEDPVFAGGSDVYPEPGNSDSWAVWSGTSFAAPQIAALIAKKCLDDSTSPQDAAKALFPAEGRPKDGFGTRVFPLRGTRPAQSPEAD
jgi:Subtilase family